MDDQVEQVISEEAFAFAKRIAEEEGILVEIACDAAAAIAFR